jgi:endonuclease/exonuclease/phosphatase family metal-dependent hydrolase
MNALANRLAAVALLLLTISCAPVQRAPHEVPVRVMSYNIRSGNGNLDETADAIRASSPDIVALQEVDVHWAERSAFMDEASGLAERLEMAVIFAPIYRLPPAAGGAVLREFGVALLSRFPIVRWSNDSLMRLSTQEEHPVPRRMPGLLDATLDVHGTLVRVLDTHLDYRADPAVRSKQVAEMLNYLNDRSMPTVVCGDMNATPRAPELQPLLHALRDSWSGPPDSGATYPADHPTERIDYILVTADFRVLSTSVPVTLASDHRPVVATVALHGTEWR